MNIDHADTMTDAEHDELLVAPHPAVYSPEVLDAIDVVMERYLPSPERAPARVLDPYAGRGSGVDRWCERGYDARGVELEPEWAAGSERVHVGDVLHLDPRALFGVDEVDAVITSPCYGNRMADAHEAKDDCKTCGGNGCDHACGLCRHANAGPDSHKVCRTCKGAGLSPRITYRHKLGRMPTDGSAAVLQWGKAYRDHHQLAIGSMLHALAAGEAGLLVINMKNHPLLEVEQLVVEWWINTLLVRGCRMLEVTRVDTRGMGFGAGGQNRAECEFLIVVRPPATRGLL